MIAALLSAMLLVGGFGSVSKDGDGRAVIDFNGTHGNRIEVVCGSVGTWRITYTVPPGGMEIGGGIEIWREPNKYWLGQCKQTENPKALDYLTAKRSDGGPITFDYIGRFYKDHREARVKLTDMPMKAGSTITVVFGDRSAGSMGTIVPFSWQPPAVYHVMSDLDGDGRGERIKEPLAIVPVAGSVAKFVVDLPLVRSVGEKAKLRVRPEDKSSNVADWFEGEVALSCDDARAKLPRSVRFNKADEGIKAVDVTFGSPGIHYVTARLAGKPAQGSSNPVKVVSAKPEYRVYRGDMHCHTEESDGTGSLDSNYQYARDTSWLDFIGVTDHLVWDQQKKAVPSCDGTLRRTLGEWNDLQSAAARKYHEPGKFVTFLAYEWSGGSEVGGDHNAYYVDDRARVAGHSNLNDEYADLRSRGEKAAFIFPHVGGRTADPKWHDAAVEPEVEINSMHGHFEWFGQAYLKKGYKVGFNGGSDGHFGLPGNDLWANHGRLGFERRDTSVPQGTACVSAKALTREGIRDAIYARRTYATTGVKMLLEVTMDGHTMGEDYSSNVAPTMHVFAAGTGEIGRIEVIRNQSRVFNGKTSGKVVELDFIDSSAEPGGNYYYVRVSQNDGEIAWSSPIFFRYTGEILRAAQDDGRVQAWNYESEEDELGDPVGKDYLPDLLDHLSWRAPDRFTDLKQVRMVHNPRGDYALFWGMDKKTKGRVHIRWYVGFESPRMHAAAGWRDFGSARD